MMSFWTKITAAMAAPVFLSGCLFLPGNFNAKLSLMDGGKYQFAYTGQMQIFNGDQKEMSPPKKVAFNTDYAKCNDYISENGKKTTNIYYEYYNAESDVDYEDVEAIEATADAMAAAEDAAEAAEDAAESAADAAGDEGFPRTEERDCTAAEIADLKTKEAKRFENKEKEYETMSTAMASAFGGAIPGNDKALKKFAENLMKYEGWQKVEYVGDNMFDVEYSASGNFDSYFAFPIMKDAAMQYPFFQIVPRKSGELEIVTPALGGQNSFMAMAMMGGSKGGSGRDLPIKNISGTLTLETNGDLVVNNSADGYTEKGDIKTVIWKVENMSENPRALIRFK